MIKIQPIKDDDICPECGGRGYNFKDNHCLADSEKYERYYPTCRRCYETGFYHAGINIGFLMKQTKGQIVEIEKYQSRATYIKQGVKGSDQCKYDNYPGENGTYVTGDEYFGTVSNVKIFIYGINNCKTFDVYEDVLKLAGKKKVSSKLLEIIESHEGDKVDVYIDDGSNFEFNASVLLT